MIVSHLNQSAHHLLKQLENTISQLSDEQFCASIALLGGSTIGEHIRHILEFYVELLNGYEAGVINYDHRKRDNDLQTIRKAAIFKIKQLIPLLLKEDVNLLIAVNSDGVCVEQLPTNYAREMMYNLDHTIHHMALIRVGVSIVSKISLPANFGVATSTIKFRETCAP